MSTVLQPGDYTVPQPPPPDQSMLLPQPSLVGLESLPTTTDASVRTPGFWVQPGDTGGTGGGTALPHGTWTSVPNADGSRKWTFNPVVRAQGQPWDTFYNFTRRMTSTPNQTNWVFNGQFFITDLPNWTAIETDMECVDGSNNAIDMGSQFLIAGTPVFHVWDYVKKWIPVASVTMPDMSKPVAFSHRGVADWKKLTMTFVETVINGQTFPVGITTATTKKPGKSYVNFAWQCDPKNQGQPCNVTWRGMELIVW